MTIMRPSSEPRSQPQPLLFLLLVLLLLLISVIGASGAGARAGFGRLSEADSVRGIPAELLHRIESRRAASTAFDLPSQPRNVSRVDVYDFGAVGDGQTDDTSAFQAAFNAIQQAGGGTVVAPRGYFLFKGTLNIPAGVTLEGTYTTVPSHPMAGSDHLPVVTGTLLLPTAGRGQENGTSFISLNRDSTVRGLVIYYPEQSLHGAAPIPFPWTIDLLSDNAAVLDVEALNPWNLIRANGSGRHYIARVQGQPINIGVYIDQTYDIGRVENVHFNPWYSVDRVFMAWQLAHGRAFVVARSDWEYFFNTFAFGYWIGYHFIESSAGSCNGNFLGIGADMAVHASVRVDSSDRWGILITNGEFTAFMDPHFGNTTENSTQIVVTASNSGSVRLVNTAFWGPSHQIARLDGSGTVGFGDCIFSQWDATGAGLYAISVTGTGNLLVRGCEFQQVGNQVQLGQQVKKSVITGNIIQGPLKIQGNGREVVGLNAHD